MQPAFSIEFAPKNSWVVDRRTEAGSILARIASCDSRRMMFLGPNEAGKSALLQWWVMPALARHSQVFYAKCSTELPAHCDVIARKERVSLETAMGSDGLVFLDSFDCLLSQSNAGLREKAVQTLKHAAARVVLVCSDEYLRELLMLRSEIPEMFDNRMEIEALSLEESISRLLPPEGEHRCECSPGFVEALREDLLSFAINGDSVSPSTLTVLAAELHERLYLNPGGILEQRHYQQAGGMRVLLDSYVTKVLKTMPDSVAPRGAARVLLESLACTTAGTAEDPAAVAARIESEEEICRRALAWLTDDSGLLKRSCNGKLQLIPPPLAAVLDEQVTLRARAARPAMQIVQNGLRSWNEIGTLLPPRRFAEVHRYRFDLSVTKEQAIFLAESAISCGKDVQDGAAAYWLRRVHDADEEAGILLRVLASRDSAVRASAVCLLGNHHNPEIRSELYRVALEDSDPSVRAEARAALNLFETKGVMWAHVAQEAGDSGSPYRIAAIQALAIFPSAESAQLLNLLVAKRGTEPPVRSAAIEALAAMGSPESIAALVHIALRDVDESDRHGAAAELAKLDSPELAAYEIAYMRAEEKRAGQLVPKARMLLVPGTLLRYVGAGFVALAAVFIPSILSFCLRWHVTGAILTVAWFASVIGVWLAAQHYVNGAIGMLALAIIVHAVSWIVPASSLIRGRVQERISGRSFRGALGAWSFAVVTIASFFSVHGILHFISQVWRQGNRLLGLQTLGTLCIAFYLVVRATYSIVIGPRMGILYLAIGLGLWVVTWALDAFLTAERLLRPAAVLIRDRQTELWQVLLSNQRVARAVFDAADSPDPETRKWARRLGRRFAECVPDALWIDALRNYGPEAPSWCAFGLRRAKLLGSVREIRAIWATSDRQMRSRLVGLLASNPNEIPTRCCNAFLSEVRWTDRIFCAFQRFAVRLRAIPAGVWICGALLMPIVAGLALEAIYIGTDSSRLLVRILESPDAVNQQPSFVIATASYLLQAYPARTQSALTVLEKIVRTNSPQRLQAITTLTSHSDQVENSGVAEGAQKLLAGIVPEMLALLREVGSQQSDPGQKRVQRRLIEALQAVNNDRAAVALGDVVVEFSRPAQTDRIGSSTLRPLGEPINPELCREAIRALGSMPLDSADAVLRRVARQAKTPRIKDEAQTAYMDMKTQLVDKVRADLSAGALDKVIAAHPVVERRLGDDARNLRRLISFVAQAKARLAEASTDPEEALRLGNEAVAHLNRITQSSSELTARAESLIYFRQSERLNGAGRYLEALAAIDRAVQLTPDALGIRAMKAVMLFNSSRTQEALTEVRAIQRLNPDYAFAHRVEGEIEMRRKQYQRALRPLQKAVELDPSESVAYSLIGETYHRLNQDREGVRVLGELYRRHKASAALLSQMYIYHENLSGSEPSAFADNYRLHEELLATFRDSLGNDYSVLASYAEASFTSGRHAEAIRRANDVLAKGNAPERIALPLHVVLCAAYTTTNDRSRAATQLHEIQRLLASGGVSKDDWSYRGLVNYIRTLPWDSAVKSGFSALAGQIMDDPRQVTPAMFADLNRALLRK